MQMRSSNEFERTARTNVFEFEFAGEPWPYALRPQLISRM
jgi:hypothetical protein